MRFFNTAGPMKPDDHYCIPPLSRLDQRELLTLIRQQRYFVLHAPRHSRTRAYLDRCGAAEGHRVIAPLLSGSADPEVRRRDTAAEPPVTVWGK